MTETLGDRIRAKRERVQVVGDTARDAAKEYAQNLRDVLKTYVDNQINQTRNQSKTYVDNQIAKLCADNGLTPPP